ncbi:MAG: agmatinase [Gemmatimonadota bacterium]|nr:agmatinase [Gemmatimonadota bacterium]
MIEALRDLPWEAPHTFLGLDGADGDFDRARAVLLPVPYESTTSYGGGTREGPRTIIEASRYVELFDQELGGEPALGYGVHTLPSLELTKAGAAHAMEQLGEAYARVAEACDDRFLLMLGGEHSLTGPAVLAQAERSDTRLSVLQMDAHADLRRSYEGTPHSHAAVMGRVLDRVDVVGVGIRATSEEEQALSEATSGSELVWADAMWESDRWMDRALDALGPRVYLTFDVDYFDPSLVPSTGTPEPGGGDWYRTLRFLKRVFAEREVVAADVVEHAPMAGNHAPDFLIAKLVYKLLSYRFASELG